MTVKGDQSRLIERIRVLLVDEQSTTREVSMFGGRSFMVDDKMAFSVLRNGDLLVRVAPEQDVELLEKPGAARAEMGAGRSMGPGWISVSAESIASKKQLSFWIRVALEHNRRSAKGTSG